MTEKFQAEHPNAHYLANLNNLNQTNTSVHLSRLPTLGEILSNKTKSPVNLHTFFLYMQHVEKNPDLLDFWFDLINHLNLCKHYVRGLRESIARNSVAHSHTPELNRGSVPATEGSKHKSLSSSILLDLIINDHILEDNDSNRLSEFLRGEINLENADPKIQKLIEQYNDDADENDTDVDPPTPIVDNASYGYFTEKRVSSNSRLLDDPAGENNRSSHYRRLTGGNRRSSINPSLLERLIRDTNASTGSFITRSNLRESSHNLLLKYFVEDSEKNLNLPPKLNNHIIHAVEVEGRDDPDVFQPVKKYVFALIESHYMPNFLNFVAIKNVNRTVNIRIIVGFFFIFASFWIAYTLIFLNYKKGYRVTTLVSFLIGFYCLISSLYRIDPLLAMAGRSESFIPSTYFLRLEDRFIYRLLVKRSLWVMALILLCTAVLTIVFSLVPGRRI